MAKSSEPNQLSLFGAVAPTGARAVAPAIRDEDASVALSLPSFVRFGTSSWSFPGWANLVWAGRYTESELARGGLSAYAQHPLLRCVSLDRGYYAPVPVTELASYRAELTSAEEKTPLRQRFHLVSKVWEEITTLVVPRHARYGARAGLANPHFLDARRFATEVLSPMHEAGLLDYHGPFLFELTPMPRGAIDERVLIARVSDFISELPSRGANGQPLRYAFELRNAELFGPRWLDMLRANGAAHVFNYWTAMPPLNVQLAAARRSSGGSLSRSTGFAVARLMLPPFTRYADQKREMSPFDKIVAPQPTMRQDVIALLRAAAEAGCADAYVLVNNKAEGSAPLTVRALAAEASAALR